jgi:low temperature requirement protein LtrA
MPEQLEKRVSMIELFYDLVFAYMISQATELISEVHHGVVTVSSFIIFAMVIVIFINSWMVQAVFTNRYGQGNWRDIGFYFVDMMILLYMVGAFKTISAANFMQLFLAAGLLSLTLMCQYLLVYLHAKSPVDRKISAAFTGILALRTVTFLIGGLSNTVWARWVAIIGLIVSWLLPGFTGKYTKQHPIIFSHLLERLTLLIIIVFGETIIGVADYFAPGELSLNSILIFAIVACLFFTYITEFDHLIENKRRGETGNLLIYLHYFILFGLILITVALKFVGEKNVQHQFGVSILYAGLLLFYVGLMLAQRYNRHNVRNFSWQMQLVLLGLLIIAYVLSLISSTLLSTTAIAAVVTAIIAGAKVRLVYQAREK